MGFRKFLKAGKENPPLLIGGGAELELHKHFRLVRKLGQGSYSTVYEAERLTDGHHYALKITELQSLSQPDKAAVVEEIRLLASLSHPNIIAYREAFCERDSLCVVTELVQGGDLGSLIAKLRAREDFLWERQVWDFFLQIALGVQYLHHNHVLHRDLKPGNLLLTDRGVVKIADLGVSSELARVFTTIQIGTPHYMAPEMWRRKAYSYSADIWALGCILHELCTLKPTFLSEHTRTEEDIMQRVLAGRYDPVPSRYSFDLARLVAAMLRPDPKERPTIDEILHMPEVRQRLHHLPQQLREAAAAAASGSGAKLSRLRPSRSMEFRLLDEDTQQLNCLLPRARYPTGGGVADVLCSARAALPSRRSFSSPDLEALAAGQQAQQQPPTAAQQLDGQQQQQHRGSGAGPQAAQPGRPDDEDERLRRRSIQVGYLLHQLQRQEDANSGAEGSGNGGPQQHRLLPQLPAVLEDPVSSAGGERGGSSQAGGSSSFSFGGERGCTAWQAPPSMSRRSVTIAEVLYYEEVKKKLGERGASEAHDLPRVQHPLPRQPFEFCAPATAPPAHHHNQPAAQHAQQQQPNSNQQQQQQQQPYSNQQQQQQQQPYSNQQQPPGPPTSQVAASAAAAGGRPEASMGKGAGAEQPEGKEKKKKWHGRLWRLMHGSEQDASMHQDY